MTDAEKIRVLREALQSAFRVANEAREEWDKAPEGMRAGKLLIALSGGLKGYRADIDAIHDALSATEPAPRDSSAHDLYKTGDQGAPEQIKDGNGEVVLKLCKKCGRAEVELTSDCDSSAPGETWQPITTAPIDRWIWVYVAAREGLPAFQCVCHWHPDAGFCCDELRFPTHWRELRDFPPPQPAAGDGGGGGSK